MCRKSIKRILSGLNVFRDTQNCGRFGISRIGKEALARWGQLLQILDFSPADDLETWKGFWLKGDLNRRALLQQRLRYEPYFRNDVSSSKYYGGKEAARSHKEVLACKIAHFDIHGQTWRVVQRTLEGERVFPVSRRAAAPVIAEWEHLLNMLSFHRVTISRLGSACIQIKPSTYRAYGGSSIKIIVTYSPANITGGWLQRRSTLNFSVDVHHK